MNQAIKNTHQHSSTLMRGYFGKHALPCSYICYRYKQELNLQWNRKIFAENSDLQRQTRLPAFLQSYCHNLANLKFGCFYLVSHLAQLIFCWIFISLQLEQVNLSPTQSYTWLATLDSSHQWHNAITEGSGSNYIFACSKFLSRDP